MEIKKISYQKQRISNSNGCTPSRAPDLENSLLFDENHPKRKIILATSANLFLNYGFHKTSINDISNNSQIDKASIYYYFRDKANIAHSILNRVSTFYQKNLFDLIESLNNLPKRQIAIRFIDQLNALIDAGHIWLLFTYDLGTEDFPDLQNQIEALIKQWTDSIEQLLDTLDPISISNKMAAEVSFELIIASMQTKRRKKNNACSRICLKRLLRSLWLN